MTELEDYLLDKQAETSGTHVMPSGAPTYTDRNRSPTKTIRKVGEVLDTNEEGVPGEQVQRLPQAAPIKLRVDTTDKEAPTLPSTKEAHRYALPSLRRYPLDSYAHVKTAAAYFDENYRFFAPEFRREYCENLVKRAAALGIEVSPEVRKYGAEGYASPAELDVAFSGRVGVIKEAAHLEVLKGLQESRLRMLPEDFAVALGEFDKVASIDHLYDDHVLDPYYSTYGEKRASEDEEGALVVGNDYITYQALRYSAGMISKKLELVFGADFVKEFRKDPVGITKSLPIDQSKIIIRLTNSAIDDPSTF